MSRTIDERANSNSSKFFGDTIVIALATAFGYFITSKIEASYVSYFGISPNFSLVSPPAAEIIFYTFSICFLMIFCLLISGPIYRLIAPKLETKEDLSRHLWSILLSYFVPFILIKILLIGISLALVIEWIALSLPFLLGILTGYLLTRKGFKTRKHILDQLFLQSHIIGFMKKNRPTIGLWFALALGLLITLNLAPDVGTSIATRGVTYSVTNTNPPLVVVAQYGNILIAKPFDQNNRQLINQIHLIDVNTLETRGLYLSQETIGPLKPFMEMESKNVWNKIAAWIEWRSQSLIHN